jgi:hypothetical protein
MQPNDHQYGDLGARQAQDGEGSRDASAGDSSLLKGATIPVM